MHPNNLLARLSVKVLGANPQAVASVASSPHLVALEDINRECSSKTSGMVHQGPSDSLSMEVGIAKDRHHLGVAQSNEAHDRLVENMNPDFRSGNINGGDFSPSSRMNSAGRTACATRDARHQTSISSGRSVS